MHLKIECLLYERRVENILFMMLSIFMDLEHKITKRLHHLNNKASNLKKQSMFLEVEQCPHGPYKYDSNTAEVSS